MGFRHLKAVKQLLKNMPTDGPPKIVKKAQETVLRQAADTARLALETGRINLDNYGDTIGAIEYYLERYGIEIEWGQWMNRYRYFEEPLEQREKEEVMEKEESKLEGVTALLHSLAVFETCEDVGMTEEEMFDFYIKAETHYRLNSNLKPEVLIKRVDDFVAWTAERMTEKSSE